MKQKKFTRLKISKREMDFVCNPVYATTEHPMQESCYCTDSTPDADELNDFTHLQITPHARQRASNRGITRDMIENTLKYGAKICRQGLCFFVMPARVSQSLFTKQFAEKIANMVVLVKRPGIVITVYKNQHALRNIKRKPKRLLHTDANTIRHIKLKRKLGLY